MKTILSTALLLFFAMHLSAQELNKKMEDPTKHKEVMLNICTREGITTFDEFKASYDPNYAAYKVDSTLIKELGKLAKGKKITIVLGTWCGDSKYQVPNFLKVADALNLSDNDITIIAVDGTKKAENGLIDKLKIERVPTFIFNDKKGVEIGRITESPKETLEKDMLKILTEVKAKAK
ncbi:MAG: thioredoxin family protein [Pedobacter sp.]|nr:thioredoxin family protein [Pedobacter sp.]